MTQDQDFTNAEEVKAIVTQLLSLRDHIQIVPGFRGDKLQMTVELATDPKQMALTGEVIMAIFGKGKDGFIESMMPHSLSVTVDNPSGITPDIARSLLINGLQDARDVPWDLTNLVKTINDNVRQRVHSHEQKDDPAPEPSSGLPPAVARPKKPALAH